MKKNVLLIATSLMALSLTSCGKQETPSTVVEDTIKSFVIGTTASIETALIGEYNYEMLASGTTNLSLIRQDTTGSFHPQIASYSTNDATTWTYTILDGMKWDDGVEVTAEDILFTLQYEDSNGSANLIDQTNSEGKVTAKKYASYELSSDKKSISLTLASSNVRELSNMNTFKLLPKHIYEKETLTDADKRVGNGPLKFDSFNKDAGTITFVKNPYYPGDVKVEKVVYQLFNNEDTMYTALTTGDVDMVWAYSTGVSSTYADVLASSTSVSLVSVAATNAPAVLAFNNAKGPFADKNLRKAVSFAIDYEAFKNTFGSSYAQVPNSGFVPTSTVGYKETSKLEKDLTKSAEYLASAGYTSKNANGYYVNSKNEEVGFTLTINSSKDAHVRYGELVKTNLAAAGINVTLETLDSTSYNAKTSNKFSNNNITMEAAIYGYTSAGMAMKDGLASIYVDASHAVQGGCQVTSETFKTALSKMSGAKTIEQYNQGASELQDFYSSETPLLALYWDNLLFAHSSKYENISADYVYGLNNPNNWLTITKK